MQVLALYADGGCNNKTGVGAFAFVCINLAHPDQIRTTNREGHFILGYAQKHVGATNNTMEMQAVLQGLKVCKHYGIYLNYIITDSQYVQRGLQEWSGGWIQRGWRNAEGSPVKNRDIWEALLKEWQPQIPILHVRGHQGVYWNEACDKYCTQVMDGSSMRLQKVQG
jgi:ribonuclease HI